ncbi:MAG: hypothetical protein JST28_20855 [Acidobacteria bacterium]|nr:hypothetical protein [Acidobacteriota bacterium]
MRRYVWKLLQLACQRLPRDFRVLHAQFLLRVIDLEALSIDADIPRFLGQFAGVLIMFSFLHAFAVYVAVLEYPFRLEHYLISTMMLVAGLITVVSWDSIFPDRRDVMVLGPLPLRSATVLAAKLCASASLLGVAILALNSAPGLVAPLLLGQLHASIFGFFQVLAAYWITMIAATLFLFCSVLTIQGVASLLLPYRLFLRLSAMLQLVCFAVFLTVYFFEPALGTLPELLAAQNQQVMACSPQFWFLGLFNQINGSLPPQLSWLAARAWTALAIVVAGAGISLLLSYMRVMKKIVEQPDLDPTRSSGRLLPRLGGSLQAAIALFCFRSITRSRQHRIALAFCWSIVFAIFVSMLRQVARNTPEPVSLDLIMPTIVMMCCAVLGLRGLFSLPISLKANWMLRVTQLRPTRDYIAATRRTLQLIGVLPVLAASAALAYHFRPLQHAYQHIAFLALFGCILVEVSLFHFDKVPFTCSFVPGKTNIQVIFWGAAFAFMMLSLLFGIYELKALDRLSSYAILMGCSTTIVVGLWIFNRIHAGSAVLYYDEVLPEIITRLGLTLLPPSPSPKVAKVDGA